MDRNGHLWRGDGRVFPGEVSYGPCLWVQLTLIREEGKEAAVMQPRLFVGGSQLRPFSAPPEPHSLVQGGPVGETLEVHASLRA